jgi:hypothetical protein
MSGSSFHSKYFFAEVKEGEVNSGGERLTSGVEVIRLRAHDFSNMWKRTLEDSRSKPEVGQWRGEGR